MGTKVDIFISILWHQKQGPDAKMKVSYYGRARSGDLFLWEVILTASSAILERVTTELQIQSKLYEKLLLLISCVDCINISLL